jgi:hypothetical protein
MESIQERSEPKDFDSFPLAAPRDSELPESALILSSLPPYSSYRPFQVKLAKPSPHWYTSLWQREAAAAVVGC